MRPVSNQLVIFYGTTKTHQEILHEKNLKCRPIIDQMGLYVYKSAKIISNVLKSLYQNEYFILDNQQFSDMLSSLPPLLDDEEDVPYEVESSFTNIANRDTMEYII